MQKLVLALDEDKLIWLRRIIMDEDKNEALAFLSTVLKPKLKGLERPSGMQRTCDSGSPPGLTSGTVS